VRLTYDKAAGTLSNPVVVIAGLPVGNDHVSGRLKIGPDRKLYYTVGDEGHNQLGNFCLPIEAQRLPTQAEVDGKAYLAYVGKSLRLNLDGSVPADNPKRSTALSATSTPTAIATCRASTSDQTARSTLPSRVPRPTTRSTS
jgi:glucose/arabinose dehydrogenase